MYEPPVFAKVLWLARCYGQLILGVVACMEAFQRRWQLIWEVHRDSKVPRYEAADHFGTGSRRSTVAPALTQQAARSMRKEDIEKRESKVSELRCAPETATKKQ